MTTGQLPIIRMHFITLRAAVKLEARGMKRSRKPSAKQISIKELSLPKASSYEEVISALNKKIEPPKEYVSSARYCGDCGKYMPIGYCSVCDRDMAD